MRRLKVVGFMLAGLLALPGAVRSAHAAPLFAYCLAIDGHADQYFLNFNVQGNSIMVSGMMNRVGDDHGPIAGSVSPAPSPSTGLEMGLTITYTNGGDYTGPNFQNMVFRFNTNGSISFRRSVQGTSGFTQGLAHAIACPQI
jgi:hypothetical protein